MAKISCLCLSVVLACLLGAAPGDEKLSIAGVPPVVVKTVPEAGATDVDPAITEIKVTFSKDMADKSWSWSTAAKARRKWADKPERGINPDLSRRSRS